MSKLIKFTIDGKECMAEEGSYLIDAARENNIYIPSLCNIQGVKPRGSCRICTVKVNGKLMTACTTPVTNNMEIENEISELDELRKKILEMFFVEGNHLCPSCEKSGACELQALAYKYRMTAPRFPFFYPVREVEASSPKLVKDHNRCILCKRCIRAIKDENGKSFFAFKERGHKLEINLDQELSAKITEDIARKAQDICPVGALLKKDEGFDIPIGQRKYDYEEIGSTIEKS